MHMLPLSVLLAAGVTVGICAGTFGAVWIWLDTITQRQVRVMTREINRLVAQDEINKAAWQRTQARYRAQRAELLAVIDRERSEMQEIRLTARAREEQIRRQIADSTFGAV